MDIKSNLENLRLQSYRFFPLNSSFISRFLARIPVFFLSIAAAFNEAILGIKGLLFKADVRTSAHDSVTARTSRVSLEIFSLLWNKPTNEAILAAQLTKALSKLPEFDTGQSQHYTLNLDQTIGFQRLDLAKISASYKDVATFISTYKSQESASTLSLIKMKHENKEVENFLSSIYNLNELDLKILPLDTQTAIKETLISNYGSTFFDRDMVADLRDSPVKEALFQLIAKKLGTLEQLEVAASRKEQAVLAYLKFQAETRSIGLSLGSLEELERSVSSGRDSRSGSLESVGSELSLASDADFSSNYPMYLEDLRDILKQETLTQFSRDCNRQTLELNLPGKSIPSFNKVNDKMEKSMASLDNDTFLEEAMAGFLQEFTKKLTLLKSLDDRYKDFVIPDDLNVIPSEILSHKQIEIPSLEGYIQNRWKNKVLATTKKVFTADYYNSIDKELKQIFPEKSNYKRLKQTLGIMTSLYQAIEGDICTRKMISAQAFLKPLLEPYGFKPDPSYPSVFISGEGASRVEISSLVLGAGREKGDLKRSVLFEDGQIKVLHERNCVATVSVQLGDRSKIFNLPYDLTTKIESTSQLLRIEEISSNVGYDKVFFRG